MENLVGYVRRNFLVPLPRVTSLEELNALLRERCRSSLGRRLQGQDRTVAEAWEEERGPRSGGKSELSSASPHWRPPISTSGLLSGRR